MDSWSIPIFKIRIDLSNRNFQKIKSKCRDNVCVLDFSTINNCKIIIKKITSQSHEYHGNQRWKIAFYNRSIDKYLVRRRNRLYCFNSETCVSSAYTNKCTLQLFHYRGTRFLQILSSNILFVFCFYLFMYYFSQRQANV